MSFIGRGLGIGFLLIAILAALSVPSMWYNFLLFSSDGLGPPPSLKYQLGETPCKACWVVYQNAKYDIFDVRIQRTTLVFMVVSRNGVTELYPDVLSKALSIRLVMQMAHLLKTVTSNANSVDSLVNFLEPIIRGAIELAWLSRQWKVARELKEIELSFGKIQNLASKLVEVLSISEPQAERLLREHSYEASEKFIVSLLATGLLFSSSKVARLFIFMTTLATVLLAPPSAEWFDMLYENVAIADPTNVMSLISTTFGIHEANRTLSEVAIR